MGALSGDIFVLNVSYASIYIMDGFSFDPIYSSDFLLGDNYSAFL